MNSNHNIGFWIGQVLKVLLILFMAFDAITKIIKHHQSMEASAKLGIAPALVPALGIMLLIFIILYAVPLTSTFGLILITAYLGGATAVMIQANMGGHPYFFPIVFGIVLWISQVLISPEIRKLLFSPK
ncbi:hypothetical protein A4H97_08430 [Niastella yeongjuensis]|uniref:DoxX family protein n=1 Tax=Niastella yeongjuensis TaxID=354355 RepID=A0A1V9ENQ0_9BACT|nr:DoxX family protein [Niastella yeongjuensis]OQP47505.1 hypothetical protein A4H97_08430 [Niastella yeongjuensis]SEN87111.1 DoxX-like family protein [Niastella yeongjuensis]